MKANYKNWVPKLMISFVRFVSVLFAVITLFNIYLILKKGVSKMATTMITSTLIFGIVSLVFALVSNKLHYMRKAFDFSNPNSIAWKVIQYTAKKLLVQETDATILDVGCGSGALSIEVAKRNPQANVIGIDMWGLSYKKEFSKELCEENAIREGVINVRFQKGDARRLPFGDESFDGVCSNYVYHNIPGDRNKLIKESLRVLKKGGYFAIHDIFSKSKYPMLDELISDLEAEGYDMVELIDTTDGVVITKEEAKKAMLHESKLLYGRK